MKFLRRYGLRIFILLVLLVLGAVGGFVWWAGTPAGELMPIAIDALETNPNVRVNRDEWLVFEPVADVSTTGFIFYPGGHVLVDAYAPLGQAIAEAGYRVVFVPMPLNLAILNVDAANDVMAHYSDIEHWVIGGHSLGGAMAARYAYNNPDVIDGLVLLASFPEAQFDFRNRDIVIASIYGELDGLATVEEVESSFSLLPESAHIVLIEGANHAQFGWYGEQAGDNDAIVSHEAQFEQTVKGIQQVLEQVSEG